MSDRILCVGEILWDIFPSGKYIGGAPFNVACHLNQLGLDADMVSRIGNEELGIGALEQIKEKGLSQKFIQIDKKYPTGTVEVTISGKGDATYNIVSPAAWDFIELTHEIENELNNYTFLVYGSLAHRNECSSKTLQKLTSAKITKVLDVNLRYPYYSKELLKDLLYSADIVKMNFDEYLLFAEWFGLSPELEKGIFEFADMFSCCNICVTLGDQGSAIYRNNSFSKHEGYSVKVKDTVGSGDAFLAALLKGISENMNNKELIKYANSVGSYVASQDGATPKLNIE